MDLEPLSNSASVSTLDAPAAHSSARIVADDEVSDLVSSRGIQADYARVLQRLEEIFLPEKITVECVPSHEEDGTGETRLLFLVQCAMDRERFHVNADRFFEPLRRDRPPIYYLIGLHRDI